MKPNQQNPRKHLPSRAAQHTATGPYSPVLEIDAGKLVVIAGQSPFDEEGNTVGDTIERQTEVTLANCLQQLETAGCSFADVFKVNAYLTDLEEWDRFNAVYEAHMPEPRPARTTIGCALLNGCKVEIDMWAVKSA